jgi:ubiquinone/menaquinone biosynthesis C-methylase UbiE
MCTDVSDKNRFMSMAADYDLMVPHLLPQYGFLQEEMIRQTGLAHLSHPRIVDLGAGSGLFIEKLLDRNPDAACWWVDSSAAFLEVARRRLERFGDRVRFMLCPFEEPWEKELGDPADCIFSMSAIHHLEHDEKRSLYRRCFEALGDGGWFVNTDEMKTLYDDAYLASLHHWVLHVDTSGGSIPAELQEQYRRWNAHFDRWKHRNIDRIDEPRSKGDDLHEGFVEQVRWLKEIGFVEVDVFVKYRLWCSIGGRKPG